MSDEHFDPDTDLFRFETLNADDLFEIQREARSLGVPLMEGRVEVERQNVRQYNSYNPALTSQEVYQVGVKLLDAKQTHYENDNDHRVQVLERLGGLFVDQIDGDTELEVYEPDTHPTIDELLEDEQ